MTKGFFTLILSHKKTPLSFSHLTIFAYLCIIKHIIN